MTTPIDINKLSSLEWGITALTYLKCSIGKPWELDIIEKTAYNEINFAINILNGMMKELGEK